MKKPSSRIIRGRLKGAFLCSAIILFLVLFADFLMRKRNFEYAYWRYDGNLNGTSWNDTKLDDFELGQVNLSHSSLEFASLRHAKLNRATLSSSSLRYADFSHASLESANLSGSDCHSAIFYRTNLRNCDLSNVKLREARFWGADLSGAFISGTEFNFASYDDKTIWPVGFDPRKSGAKKIDFEGRDWLFYDRGKSVR